MTIRGSVDSLTPEGASGWAFAGGTGGPLVVQALLDGRVIGETVAESDRPDLSAAGLGDGRCGFAMAFYEAPLDPAMLPFISIRPRGGDVELPRTNLTGYGDFFRTIHARHPGAGRHRSVFGGLWTDRTDARRLLAGRVATGATPPDLQGPLREFIGEGYAVFPDVLPGSASLAGNPGPTGTVEPGAGPGARRFLESLPDLLFRDAALRLMRAVLDDNPTAYRVAVTRHGDAATGFTQASAAERLPSPAECLLLVACAGTAPIALDVVRGSHELPEFTPHGRSRWLAEALPGREPAGVELAREFGASVGTVEIGPRDLALLGPGTLHRVRATGADGAALRVWCVPGRTSPSRALAEESGLIVRHPSGAMLTV